MALIRLQDVNIAFGDKSLLTNASLAIEAGTRTALIGRNGEGKSTLLKLLAGSLEADSGEIIRQKGMTAAYLPQTVPEHLHGTLYAVIAGGLAGAGELLAEYHAVAHDPAIDEKGLAKLSRLQDAIDACNGWQMEQRIEQTLSRLALEPEADFSALSGGMKRRVLLGRALVTEPSLLMLDEPTNHLDINGIAWLESYLAGVNCTVVFVTHDRSFLERIAQQIVELDRGLLSQWPGNYAKYLVAKQHQLAVEEEQNALFDKKLAQEEVWIRQGIKARRTRNEGRVRALEALREQHRQRRTRQGDVNLATNDAERSGKLVFRTTQAAVEFDGKRVVSDLTLTVFRQDRLGIIGPNGCGKSTLVKLLLGELPAASGSVDPGSNVQVAYFDQLRTALDQRLSAADNVSGGADMVTVNGTSRHIMSYLQDFLFSPGKARAPIDRLSGGETNRLLLAKLFLQPSNVLVLDEPSNDLDVETLELLEALLADYKGTVILISHDRTLLDNVATRSLVFQGNGRFVEVVGGYADYERELAAGAGWKPMSELATDNFGALAAARGAQTAAAGADNPTPTSGDTSAATARRTPKKLSYKERLELDALPERISALETRIAALQSELGRAEVYTDATRLQQVTDELHIGQRQLDTDFNRWTELEDRAG